MTQRWVIPCICVAGVVLAVVTIVLRPRPQVTTKLTDPDSSCATAEYTSEKAQLPNNFDVNGYKGPLVVVSGRSPINTTQEVRIGQPVTVCVMGLHRWIYEEQHTPSQLRLFVGGAVLANVAPTALSPRNQEYLKFLPEMDTADSTDWQAWASIVGAARHSHNYVLPISIAMSDTKEVVESDVDVSVDPYPPNWIELAGVLILLLAALVYLARTSDLLRYAVNGRPETPEQSPYSLGLTQMAFWFYLVIAAYVYIAVSMRQIHIPLGSVLGLLGISSTTGLAAVVVDKQKTASSKDQQAALLAEQKVLQTDIANLTAKNPATGSPEATELANKNARQLEIQNLLSQLAGTKPATSKGFIDDILNDGDGMSFHRFQIVVWTIVLGVAFVWSVYRNMTMPEFDASLLTLMGISSGTYVGFKFPEKLKT